MSLVTGPEPKEREREAARVTPALYQLFPSYPGATTDPDGNDVDIFDRDNMQSSIVDSLSEFVRLYSVTKSNARKERAVEILEDMLGRARQHRLNIENLKLSRAGVKRSDWLALVGVGQKTRIQLTVRDGSEGALVCHRRKSIRQ